MEQVTGKVPGGTLGIHSQLNFYGNDGVLFHK